MKKPTWIYVEKREAAGGRPHFFMSFAKRHVERPALLTPLNNNNHVLRWLQAF
ncbi:MAG: hypothetical protein LBL45_10345 [Treponema sp.]|nr:hypothetical protein [Treponema sp.]